MPGKKDLTVQKWEVAFTSIVSCAMSSLKSVCEAKRSFLPHFQKVFTTHDTGIVNENINVHALFGEIGNAINVCALAQIATQRHHLDGAVFLENFITWSQWMKVEATYVFR